MLVSMCLVRAEDKEIPENPHTKSIIEAIMNLSEEERSFVNLFNIGM